MRQHTIFYSDGSLIECGFEDDEEIEVVFKFKVSKKYFNAPIDGLQAIVQQDNIRCRHTLRGQDHYFVLPSGMVHSSDNLAPFLNEHLKGIVKFGVCLDDDEYREVLQKVKAYNRISRNCIRTETEQDVGID
jgi:hypothetical protein